MADTTAASALASSLRNLTTATSEATYRSSRPEHAVGKGISIVKQGVDGSSSSIQFDASGQIIPTGKAEKAESATASAVDLFA
ncbi:MAG: hypothetical protein ABF990_02385 [Acetobacter sp.]|uniref:hypothetical protein n=1 Tax=Acetobacter sp. TaxID=440 RepID=UPI0039E99670